MYRVLILAGTLSALLPTFARAAAEPYGIRLPPDGLVVEVPYTLGTHREHVTEVHGVVRIDPVALQLEEGHLEMPLTSFHGDDPQRDCHMREALGLDYRRSRFPREHACDAQNRLPSSGPDAIAFPSVSLALTRGGPAAGPAGRVEVAGSITVHGVSRPIRFELTVSKDGPTGMLRVQGSMPVRLSDFGIIVKSASVLFVTISVHDEVTIHVNTLLEPLRRGSSAGDDARAPARHAVMRKTGGGR